MSEVAELGTNISAPPPPPTEAPAHDQYVMALGEQFTREQYHEVGWTDEQLIACGKMILAPTIETKAAIGMPETVWVVIEEHEDIPPTGLFIGHNGTGFLAQTGIPIPMPRHVLKILDDAIMDAPVTDPKTKQVIGYRPRRRYNYRHVPPPVEA